MMLRRSFCAITVSGFAGLLSGVARGEDTVVGRVWELKFSTHGRGRGGRGRAQTDTKRFRATPDGKLFSPTGQEIGSFTEKGDEVSLKLDGRTPYHGSHKLVRRDKNPPTWQGVWTLGDGSKRSVYLTLHKD